MKSGTKLSIKIEPGRPVVKVITKEMTPFQNEITENFTNLKITPAE